MLSIQEMQIDAFPLKQREIAVSIKKKSIIGLRISIID